MSDAGQLLDTYPRDLYADAGVLATTIDALSDCAQACTADADNDLSEQNQPELVKCIRLCLDRADVCAATAGVTSRQTEYDANVTRPLLEACRELPAAMKLGQRPIRPALVPHPEAVPGESRRLARRPPTGGATTSWPATQSVRPLLCRTVNGVRRPTGRAP